MSSSQSQASRSTSFPSATPTRRTPSSTRRCEGLLATLTGNGNGTALATDGYVRTRAAVIEFHKGKSPLSAFYTDTSRPPPAEAPAKGAHKAKGCVNTQSQITTLLAEAVMAAPTAAAAPAAAADSGAGASAPPAAAPAQAPDKSRAKKSKPKPSKASGPKAPTRSNSLSSGPGRGLEVRERACARRAVLPAVRRARRRAANHRRLSRRPKVTEPQLTGRW
jgi:hypothetical protein